MNGDDLAQGPTEQHRTERVQRTSVGDELVVDLVESVDTKYPLKRKACRGTLDFDFGMKNYLTFKNLKIKK